MRNVAWFQCLSSQLTLTWGQWIFFHLLNPDWSIQTSHALAVCKAVPVPLAERLPSFGDPVPDYMANFSPGWNFNPANRAKILLRLHDELQPGLKYLPRHQIWNCARREMAPPENTNCENRWIASIAVWPFGGAQFSAFWDSNSLQDDGTEAKPVFGCISLS